MITVYVLEEEDAIQIFKTVDGMKKYLEDFWKEEHGTVDIFTCDYMLNIEDPDGNILYTYTYYPHILRD